MKHIARRTYNTMVRVRDFSESLTTVFPLASPVGQMFAEVPAIVTELEHQATIQAASAGRVRVGSATKATARAQLQERLRAIHRTVLALAVETPELKKRFRLPPKGDSHLLTAARAFLEHLEPLADEFSRHEMPDVRVNLKGDIDAFQAAVTELNHSTETLVKATASLDAVQAHGSNILQHLDAVVRNKFANDQPMLAAWESASHVERRHRVSRRKAKVDQAAPDTSKSGPSRNSSDGKDNSVV